MQWAIGILLGLALLGGVIYMVIVGNRTIAEQDENIDPLMTRLAEFSERGEVASLEQIELSQPFSQRVIVPIVRRLGEFSARFTPQKVLLDTTRKLELAGNPGRIDAATFLTTRFIVPVVFDGLLFLIARISPSPWPASRLLMVLLVFGLLGFFFPQLWLTSRINARQKEIRKAMPDALDLLTICVEAGLSFDSAISKVSEKWENQLSLAFARVIREIQLGKLQREALRDMSDRLDIPEMTSFVAAVIQSQQLGVSMAKVLRIQSEQMRMKRRQRAEEEAHKAPVKMIFPMGLLIFPSILIILLTPALIQITDVFGAALGGP
ncbi:MAG: type II secretion system protein [Anaerolineaceae bacterium]|nr:type II secretion system F family protein [Anaerolineae bacterium]MBL1172790.1 type II secretion system F family protein [Chloroflexota bacterium]MDL1926571.1 type II secretion system F family protein [Anaerolineae bacterium AMX1]WKZ52156.1 MAG: type II secretion system F family protein [Anaerolineales bacterium]GJQ38094.1 MAG: type II secretion system protein [Anaerolineaceae bacterium]